MSWHRAESPSPCLIPLPCRPAWEIWCGCWAVSFRCLVYSLLIYCRAQKDLQSGDISMDAENFPALFWSGEHPRDDFDPENILHGVFKVYMLVWVGRHIFLGPSHALGGDSVRATHTCNAILHGITTVEAEHITYICVQVGHFTSSTSSVYLNLIVLRLILQSHQWTNGVKAMVF